MGGRVQTREDDERDLVVLIRKHDGHSNAEIARDLGLKRPHVSTICARIRAADEAYEGRDLSEAYWP